jgi:hypothetical protein
LEWCEVVAAMLPKVFKAHPCFPETAGIPGEGSLLYPKFLVNYSRLPWSTAPCGQSLTAACPAGNILYTPVCLEKQVFLFGISCQLSAIS